jgi:N-acetyl-alpha-D-muramate 1-phosphate uridylyltransferase
MTATSPSHKQAIGHHAMVLAAGLGLRMRPLTLNTPKPLLKVAGKSLIDYGMDHLRAAGVQTTVVNGHYLADQIEDWVGRQSGSEMMFSDERADVLDTGGGIALALPLLGSDPFFVLNSDSFWVDGKIPALRRLRAAWRDADMDCLLLLCNVAQTVGYDGNGDFRLGSDGRLTRSKNEGALAYIGGYLVHPRLFQNAPTGKFSMNVLWDRAIAQGRLHGISHDGLWLHVGTPEAIGLAEARLTGM